MPSPTPEPAADVLARLTEELRALRGSVDGMAARLQSLVDANGALQARLEHSERARADLLAQTEHLIEKLAEARHELRGRTTPNG